MTNQQEGGKSEWPTWGNGRERDMIREGIGGTTNRSSERMEGE